MLVKEIVGEDMVNANLELHQQCRAQHMMLQTSAHGNDRAARGTLRCHKTDLLADAALMWWSRVTAASNNLDGWQALAHVSPQLRQALAWVQHRGSQVCNVTCVLYTLRCCKNACMLLPTSE